MFGSQHFTTSFRRRCLVVVISAVAILTTSAFVAGKVTAPRYGAASEVLLNGTHSGVYRLTVVTGGFGPDSAIDGSVGTVTASDYEGPLTDDQKASLDAGWDAACLSWVELGAVSVTNGLACVTTNSRPEVAASGPTLGPSAGLANALAFASDRFDVIGDLRIAATGVITVGAAGFDAAGAPLMSAIVGPVGGLDVKIDAAIAARVDLLIVPEGNRDYVAPYTAKLSAAGIPVVYVDTVTEAIRFVCEASGTVVCRDRVLTG